MNDTPQAVVEKTFENYIPRIGKGIKKLQDYPTNDIKQCLLDRDKFKTISKSVDLTWSIPSFHMVNIDKLTEDHKHAKNLLVKSETRKGKERLDAFIADMKTDINPFISLYLWLLDDSEESLTLCKIYATLAARSNRDRISILMVVWLCKMYGVTIPFGNINSEGQIGIITGNGFDNAGDILTNQKFANIDQIELV